MRHQSLPVRSFRREVFVPPPLPHPPPPSPHLVASQKKQKVLQLADLNAKAVEKNPALRCRFAWRLRRPAIQARCRVAAATVPTARQ